MDVTEFASATQPKESVDDGLAAAERAYRALRTQIVSGALPGGTRLSENQVAEALGVSRTPVREALARLQTEGLVWFERYRGARVADLTDDDLRDAFELRVVLESLAAARAAERIDVATLAKLDANLRATERLLDNWTGNAVEDFVDINREFHGLVIAASGSKRLRAIVIPLIDMPTHGRASQVQDPSFVADALAHHSQVVEALRARDPEWSRAQMRAHLAQARTRGERPPIKKTQEKA